MKKLIILFLVYGITFAQQSNSSPVSLHRTENFKIESKSNGVTYPIYVAYPGSYFSTDRDYPLILMLDAYSSFGMMTEMSRLLAFNNELPEAVIVGISSEGGSKEFIYNRARDFTPTKIDPQSLPANIRLMTPISGGAEKFLEFIKGELIPFVDSKFRIMKNDKTIVGHSYGGLFCFYTLFTQPSIFNRYVIISPAVLWDNELILKMENEFAKNNSSINAVVYTTVGGREEDFFINPWKKLVASIKSHNYSNFRFIEKISEGETHYSIMPQIVTTGLISVFNEYKQNTIR